MDEQSPSLAGFDATALMWFAGAVAAVFVIIVLYDHFVLRRKNRLRQNRVAARKSRASYL